MEDAAPPRPAFALVGAGAVGRALGLRLAAAGHAVAGVVSRTRASASALADVLGAPVASDRLADLPAAPLVALCVPDGEIAGVARALAGLDRAWGGAVVLHTSGATPASALGSLAAEGARTLSFHPLQTVPGGAGAAVFDGVTVGVEGGAEGVAAGAALAEALGMRPLVVPTAAKPLYHLAAATASNLVVALLAVAQEVLASIDVGRDDAAAMLAPLVRGTVENVLASSPEASLTGPVARGDLETLEAHGRALRTRLPHLVPAYAALSVEAVRVAVRAGRLPAERAEAVLALLEQMAAPPRPDGAAPGGTP
ncbi:Rossmann-like and DUF2520 domain-containing protein [Rubrivirga litoralis]|uniref:DUF2520 domain-containing protein n=1 Tax=Rubrivirga litoralis TaxID=3075598 RepID=A0ABU3BTD8_9BACT|nr:Rossmann-like and DUF2520 domain-containing protein [Rubrivirga sp. F394]MDT0632561.1 DUF2520 domain-containing protein [Rubrivirga sp. F394]